MGVFKELLIETIDRAEERTGLDFDFLQDLFLKEQKEVGTQNVIKMLEKLEFYEIDNNENAIKIALHATNENIYCIFAFVKEWNGEKYQNYYYFDKEAMEFIEI